MENILIIDQQKFDSLKDIFKKGGKDKIHFLIDFDRTMTKLVVKGKKVPSLTSIIRDGTYLTSDYGPKAQALFDEYHPVEIDPSIDPQKKRDLMRQWWMEHFDLLVASGLEKKDIEAVAKSGKVELRDGCFEFLQLTNTNHIPVIIMSNNGLGTYAIGQFLQNANCFFDNIHVISNEYIWDENGKAIGVKEPIMHGGNKSEVLVKNYPAVFEQIFNRKNVILVGDSDTDVGMVDGFEYDNLLKIGFLNDDVENLIQHYKKFFDVLLLNDAPINFLVDLLKQIV